MWPYTLSMVPGAATADIRVRKALNLAIDRDAIGETAEWARRPGGWLRAGDHPWFGNPTFKIKYDRPEPRS